MEKLLERNSNVDQPEPSGTIRVLLVEDSVLARVGTSTLLGAQPGLEVIGEAEDGARGVELYRALRPDVVVVDLRMPRMDGIQFIQALADERPSPRILVLTHYDGQESIFRALRAGALGYLTKDTDGEELFRAIRAVARGERYLPALLAARYDERERDPALSAREKQVLARICRGMSNKEIASDLALSEKTISMFVVRLYAKLRVHSRAEAVALALQKGLVE